MTSSHSTERTHQFTHSNTQRRATVVSGSVGKLGSFIPSDFITSPIEVTKFDDDIEPDEIQPLLDVPSNNSLKITRGSVVACELLYEECDLLNENHISYVGEEQIMDAFEDAITNRKIDHTTTSIELKSLIKSSIPLVVTLLLQNSLSSVSVFMVGHLGATELAAVSMGSMTANITGYATIQGIATALDTLCPQAFGSKKYTLVGSYLQKCTSLEFVIMLPILFIWVFYGYDLITMILPDKETAKLSAVYLQYVAFGMPAYILFECGKRFLQAQGIYHISTYVLLIAAPSNLIMNYLLVKHIGYLGAPIAVAINYWLMISLLVLFIIFFIKPEDTPSGLHPLKYWSGLDFKESFGGWGRLAQLAIPGFIMLEAEFLALEILTLIASYLGTIALAAQSIGTTMACVTYQVPFAVGIATSTRIANYLGAGLGLAARTTTKVSLILALVVAMLNFSFLFCFKRQIVQAFTKDEEVIKTLLSVMVFISLLQILDTINVTSAGCLRGQGQTKIGGIVSLVSYYCIGLPISVYLAFYSPWKGFLHGIWIGTCVAVLIIATIQSYFALSADPEKLCDDAEKRTNIESCPG